MDKNGEGEEKIVLTSCPRDLVEDGGMLGGRRGERVVRRRGG